MLLELKHLHKSAHLAILRDLIMKMYHLQGQQGEVVVTSKNPPLNNNVKQHDDNFSIT